MPFFSPIKNPKDFDLKVFLSVFTYCLNYRILNKGLFMCFKKLFINPNCFNICELMHTKDTEFSTIATVLYTTGR